MSNSFQHITNRKVETIPQLWFDDGDIMIEAESRHRIRGYKLHREVLAVHAPGFLEFLDESLAQEKASLHDVPAVFIPENVADLDALLYALYHPSSLFRWKYRPTSFQRALHLYKIAIKYRVDYVVDVLCAQLDQDWPKTLWEWDTFESDDALYVKGKYDIYLDMYAEPVAAINFARAANRLDMLPAAFYQLSRVSTGNDYYLQVDRAISMRSHSRSARWFELSKEDLLCLAAGKESLDESLVGIRMRLKKEIPNEKTHEQCHKAWVLMPTLRSNDVLKDLLEICKPDKLPGALMCKSCRRRVNENGREWRKVLWEALPGWFQLPKTVC